MKKWLSSHRDNRKVADEIEKASSKRRTLIEDTIRILKDPDYLNNPVASATLACINDIVSQFHFKL